MPDTTALRLRDIDLEKLKPLSIKQMNRLFDSDKTTTRLINLEMMAYLDNTGQVLIGFDSGVLAEERWHYCTVPPGKGLWYQFEGPLCQESSNSLSQVGGNLALDARLSNDLWLVQEVRNTALAADLVDIGPSDVLAAARLIDMDTPQDLARVSYQIGLQEIHELGYHPETWIANHVEFDGVPHELVQRMHGLVF